MPRLVFICCFIIHVTIGFAQSKNSLVSKRKQTKSELKKSQSKLLKVKQEKKHETHALNTLISSIQNDKAEMHAISHKVDSLNKTSQEKIKTYKEVKDVPLQITCTNVSMFHIFINCT